MAADSMAKGVFAGKMAVREMGNAAARAAFVYRDGAKAQVIVQTDDYEATAMMLYRAADAVADMAMLQRMARR